MIIKVIPNEKLESESGKSDLRKEMDDKSSFASKNNTENKVLEIEPKHAKELQGLETVQKELTSMGFLKRQVDTIRGAMDSVSKYVGCILQIELFEGCLTEENREFLNNTYNIKNKLKSMPGKAQLDESIEEIIREYSFN